MAKHAELVVAISHWPALVYYRFTCFQSITKTFYFALLMSNYAIELTDVSFSFRVNATGANSLREWLLRGGKEFFPKKPVLHHIHLQIEKGICFAILGRNGSGKSTLLRIISGIIEADSGKVEVKGRIAPVLSLGAGLEPELSGYDNMRLLCTLMGFNPKEIGQLIAAIADFSELTASDLQMQVKRYSTGMMARLTFSIAVASQPDILIIDEVLAVGDAGFQEKCYRRIREINQAGATVIFVSHSVPDVLQLCEQACVLADGKIVFFGDVKESCDIYTRQFQI
ncbi:MAG: ABC transporter ATP-binding protein [Flavobacteriales bacterium]|nr:ABC transporter ATP-binding protein [Flavobacteriales bacterium]